MRLNCLIIEDQLPAQRILQTYLEEIPELELIAVCTSPIEAIAYLKNFNIELIFLDIHLPKISGYDFLRSLKRPPRVIITTAYSKHAIEGFELNVVDYLLKPFSFERFFKAIGKVIPQSETIVEAKREPTGSDHIFIKIGKSVHRIDLRDLLYVKSEGDYVWIVCSSKKHLVQQSLKYWQREMGTSFLRIHKSFLINVKAIERIEGNEVIIGEVRLPIGRMYREMLQNRIKQSLK